MASNQQSWWSGNTQRTLHRTGQFGGSRGLKGGAEPVAPETG